MKVKLTNVRLAFPNLFEAKTIPGSDSGPKFSAVFLINPKSPHIKEIEAAIDQIGQDKWGAKWPTIKKAMQSQLKICLHDGSEKADVSGYEGNKFVNASNASRPIVLDRDKSPLVVTDGKPYGGCYVNATVDLWAQDNTYGKRINASLMGVQFHADGDSFSGGAIGTADDFDEVTEGADAGDLT